ncbi:hypothetical protein SynA1544_01661 [Synechococcus sp. A15-44]|nr:hypothetical protein SynA1544_01661 [Synechococcus sp. A15-44]
MSHGAQRCLLRLLRTQHQHRQQVLAQFPAGKPRSLMDFRWALSEPSGPNPASAKQRAAVVSTQQAAPDRWMTKISRLLSRPKKKMSGPKKQTR